MREQSPEQNKITRVLLVDDHRLIAEAVASMLSATNEFAVDTAESFDAASNCLKNMGPYGIVMLDLKMPGMEGIESIRKIVELTGEGRVVLFSANADPHILNRAVEIGVRGLIPKTMPLKSLISVLRLIESGQLFVPVSSMDPKNDRQERGKLSDIELYVLRLTAAGMTNKHIANDLNLNETTVKMYMRTICKKLGARNRAHAAIIGRDMNIIGS